MKLNRAVLPLNKSETFEENVDFNNQQFDENHVKRINSCSIKLTATDYGEVLECRITGEASVIASCSYTLEDVPYDVKFKEIIYFSNEETDSEDCFFEPDNEIDLDPYIIALILSEVPHNLTKSGAKLPESGQGYRVLSEDDFLEERKHKKNHAFDVLDALEIDE